MSFQLIQTEVCDTSHLTSAASFYLWITSWKWGSNLSNSRMVGPPLPVRLWLRHQTKIQWPSRLKVGCGADILTLYKLNCLIIIIIIIMTIII